MDVAQGREIEFREDIPVVHEHGTGQEQILDVLQSACSFQQHGLVAEKDRHAVVSRGLGIFGKKTDELVGQAVRVDHDALDTERRDPRESELAEWHTADGHERLGNLVGQRLQPLAPARTEQKGRPHRRTHVVPPGDSIRRMIIISDATKPWRR